MKIYNFYINTVAVFIFSLFQIIRPSHQFFDHINNNIAKQYIVNMIGNKNYKIYQKNIKLLMISKINSIKEKFNAIKNETVFDNSQKVSLFSSKY